MMKSQQRPVGGAAGMLMLRETVCVSFAGMTLASWMFFSTVNEFGYRETDVHGPPRSLKHCRCDLGRVSSVSAL